MGFDRRGDLEIGHCTVCPGIRDQRALQRLFSWRGRIGTDVVFTNQGAHCWWNHSKPNCEFVRNMGSPLCSRPSTSLLAGCRDLCAQFPQARWWCKRSQHPGAETPRMQLSRCPAGPAYPSVEANLEVWQGPPTSSHDPGVNPGLSVVLPPTLTSRWSFQTPGHSFFQGRIVTLKTTHVSSAERYHKRIWLC